MNFSISQFLNKLRNLPDIQKKIILWGVVAVLAVIMGFFWIRGTISNLQKMSQNVDQIKFPEIQSPTNDILNTTSPANN